MHCIPASKCCIAEHFSTLIFAPRFGPLQTKVHTLPLLDSTVQCGVAKRSLCALQRRIALWNSLGVYKLVWNAPNQLVNTKASKDVPCRKARYVISNWDVWISLDSSGPSRTSQFEMTYLAFRQGTSILALVCTSRFGAFRTDSYTPSEFHSAMRRCKAHKKRFTTSHCTVESNKGSLCASVWTASNQGAKIKVEKTFCNAAFQFRNSIHILWESNPATYQRNWPNGCCKIQDF